MNPYLDTDDPFYSRVHYIEKPKQQQKKKDDSIISTKILLLFGIVAIVKVAILLLWI